MRAAYAALLLGLFGGLGLATAVLSSRSHGPATIDEALGTEAHGPLMDQRRTEAVAVLVSECMARHGLRWVPLVEPPPTVPDPELGPADWARRWGFGVSTTVGRPEPSAPADPNLAAADRATPAERDAMIRALYGDDGTPGCQATANEAVYGLRGRLLAPLRDALDALETRIEADPASGRALAAWRSCVGPVAVGLQLDRRSLAGGLLERFVRRLAALGPGTASVMGLAALQADERRVATVMADCEMGYAAARAPVAGRHESVFVGEHRDALAGIRNALRAAEEALPTLAP